MRRKLTGVTMFSGIGGVEFGLGHLVRFVGAVEFDSAIAAWHRVCHPDTEMLREDVADVDYRRWAGVDYLHASPSCKNASVANANGGEAEQDTASAQAVCRAIREIKPRAFTLENVRGYAAFDCFASILATLEIEGFRYSFGFYDAADFGVPQNRVRLMLRAWRDSRPLPVIEATHGNPKEVAADNLQPKLFGESRKAWNGWYAAIADLLPGCPESKLAAWQHKRLPTEILETLLIGTQGYAGNVQHVGASTPAFTPNTTSGAGAYRAILVEGDAAGDTAPTRSVGAEPVASIRGGGGGRLHRAVLINGIAADHHGEPDTRQEKVPAPPATASGSRHPMRVVSDCRVVALTPRCLARFQMIPDSCPLPEKKSLACTMIGNAVPSEFAKAIFGPMLEILQKALAFDAGENHCLNSKCTYFSSETGESQCPKCGARMSYAQMEILP